MGFEPKVVVFWLECHFVVWFGLPNGVPTTSNSSAGVMIASRRSNRVSLVKRDVVALVYNFCLLFIGRRTQVPSPRVPEATDPLIQKQSQLRVIFS